MWIISSVVCVARAPFPIYCVGFGFTRPGVINLYNSVQTAKSLWAEKVWFDWLSKMTNWLTLLLYSFVYWEPQSIQYFILVLVYDSCNRNIITPAGYCVIGYIETKKQVHSKSTTFKKKFTSSEKKTPTIPHFLARGHDEKPVSLKGEPNCYN